VHVCMEATGIYWEEVAEFLVARNSVVSVVNPAQSRLSALPAGAHQDRSGRRQADRRVLPRTPTRPLEGTPVCEQTLRALVLRLDALQAMRTQESNRLEVARDAVRKGSRVIWNGSTRRSSHSPKRSATIDSYPDLDNKRALLDSIPAWGTHHRRVAGLLRFPERFKNADRRPVRGARSPPA